MVRGVSGAVFLCLFLMTRVCLAQDAGQIRNFDDFIRYIDQKTEYKFSYSKSLSGVPLLVPGGVDPANIEVMEQFLKTAGISMVLKKDLLIFKKSADQAKVISGYVRDAESGESLVGANVYDGFAGHGGTTNTFGFFSIATSADSLSVSYIGYQATTIAVARAGSELIVNLDRDKTVLSEVVVLGSTVPLESSEISTLKLTPDEIRKVPVFMGESDVLKTMQLLPGVQGGTEGTAGLYVRGGGPDQNLILLDGVPVYNANHVFGFFSVFNTDAIKNVTMIKGGFPARYGGRLSSIIDIGMKEGNMNKFEGEGAIGVVASKITVSGPISRGKTSFMLSGRRTYLDMFAVPIQKAAKTTRLVGANFWDLNAKVNHIFSLRDRIYLSFYSGKDNLYDHHRFTNGTTVNEKEDARIKWGNLTSAFRWNHQYGDRLFSNVTATFSNYRFDLGTVINHKYSGVVRSPDVFRENEYYSSVNDLGLKVDYDYLVGKKHSLKFGANVINHNLLPGVSRYRSHIKTDTTFGSARERLNELYIYVEDDILFTPSTTANVGIHWSAAFTDGRTYSYPQPRISLNQRVTSYLSIKASYTKMSQYIHLLVNSGVGLPTDLWVPSTKLVKPQLADQVALGVVAAGKGFEISIESYYKKMSNLIEYKDGAGFLDIDSEWEKKLEFGTGDSYGAELFVQKKSGLTTGWLAYTLAKSTRHFDNLNFGNSFPYRYDRRHNVSLVFNRAINSKIDIGAVWVYNSGNAITLPTSTYPKADWSSGGASYEDYVKHYPGRNSSRAKAYHRLDLNISFRKATRWEKGSGSSVFTMSTIA